MDNTSFKSFCHASGKIALKKGDYLFKQSDPASAIYIIKEGSLKLVRVTEGGEEIILQIVASLEVIGENALFRKEALQPASAIALEDTKICSMSRETFEKIIESNPRLACQVIENLGSRLYNLWNQMAEFNIQTTRNKLLNLFVQLAKQHGKQCSGGTLINLHLTQQELASMVGASRVMVSQVLKELIQSGSIFRNKKNYILKDRCF
ncbi:MAG: Crp/Fnr family transcriptional regulator [Ruminiclostridium sp.]|nr:Crp/Fnr family transcriptional regulator [Ruminiclostridium sp.]